MNHELEEKLIKRFPAFFADMYGDPSQTCLAFGCECNDGWLDLLYQLCFDIEQTNPPVDFKIAQIKEKFGGLRFYYYSGSPAIDRLVSQAENESFKVCEFCGSRDRVTVEGRWIRTLCQDCRSKL